MLLYIHNSCIVMFNSFTLMYFTSQTNNLKIYQILVAIITTVLKKFQYTHVSIQRQCYDLHLREISCLLGDFKILYQFKKKIKISTRYIIPYPTAFPYGNGMVLHFYQQQESSMTKTVHKVINKGLKTYV